MTKINKNDLVKSIAQAHGTTQDAARVPVDAFLDSIVQALETGNEVAIHGFGTFKPTERKARLGRNPSTGETIELAASRSASFKPAKVLKDRLNA